MVARYRRKSRPRRHLPFRSARPFPNSCCRSVPAFQKAGAAETVSAGTANLRTTQQRCASPCSPLPVRFLEVEARRTSEAWVEVQWEVTYEANNAGFTVERSLDNSTRFEAVGRVLPHANSRPVERYRFTDANDFEGTSYYRIRQTDRDSQHVYSRTVAVPGSKPAERLSVFPNPAAQQVSLAVSTKQAGSGQLTIYSSTGAVVHRQTVRLTGSTVFVSVPVAALSKGNYQVRLQLPNQTLLTQSLIRL